MLRALLVYLLFFSFLPYSGAQQASDTFAPEGESGTQETNLVSAENFMVVTANPYASQAGFQMLQLGGNSIDAMVAVQATLGLVEPQSSGLGGGGFLVYYDAVHDKLTTYDGRETAPRTATPELFLNPQGEPLEFFEAVIGGRSVGAPGLVRLLYDTHAKYGSLPWAKVLEPAIGLARQGFTVSPRLHSLIAADVANLSRYQETREYFLPSDLPLQVGSTLKNTAYAKTLETLAAGGAAAFYTGQIAEDIVATVRDAEVNPGLLGLEDLASYRVIQRAAVCTPYKSYEICGMGPPSSGGLSVGQIMGITSSFDLKEKGDKAPQSWRLIGDASRLAFADRARYMADSDFVPMPTKGLTSPGYMAERAKLLAGEKALSPEQVVAGTPPWDHAMRQADDESLELPSTTHFVIVDADGNVVSMTSSIENGFGSRLMTNGFLLNNQSTDFSFRTHRNGVPIANRVEPGKRARSSMAPTIVMQDDKPVIAIGSPGGSRIIGYVATSLLAMLEWDMNIQQAVEFPHAINRFGTYDLEKGTWMEELKEPLEMLGYDVDIKDMNSGLHGIYISSEGLEGGVDPRREGVALGQ
ncbi:gamma-glutamyltransferase [Flexibacterium corallicola]|uniref:gamma-glutamyltransferase n=1 Tax=Flexibacterium corallicola TaxID=3037259 RepID=UPI00286EDEE5|nr:gamma-glutamyltransferase [Pseudovibrio sp. M1P-2-3]